MQSGFGSRAPVFGRHDHMVGTNTVITPGGDAAVLHVKGTSWGFAFSTDGNGRLCYLDPRGMAEACRLFETPVVSGSVSLYNESNGAAIWRLIGVRGGLGNRPLALGRLGEVWMMASETRAFDSVGATFERDVKPGEIVVIDHLSMRSRQLDLPDRQALCAFESIYCQRPGSRVDGQLVHREGSLDAEAVILICDRPAAAMDIGRRHGVPVMLIEPGDHADCASHQAAIRDALVTAEVDIVALAGVSAMRA